VRSELPLSPYNFERFTVSIHGPNVATDPKDQQERESRNLADLFSWMGKEMAKTQEERAKKRGEK
jgi:hypothetical protein